MLLDWLWKKEQPLYIYYKKRVPSYYGLCGFKYIVKWEWSHCDLFRQKLQQQGYVEFYRTTYLIKQFTFDNKGVVTGFVADDSQ